MSLAQQSLESVRKIEDFTAEINQTVGAVRRNVLRWRVSDYATPLPTEVVAEPAVMVRFGGTNDLFASPGNRHTEGL